ncbi:MAG: sterol desaturase family protein [Halioglobus sp.]
MTACMVAFLLGAVLWTLLEYVLHRFVFHARSARGLGATEHRKHHAQVNYFAPAWQKALAALVATAILLPLLSSLVGLQSGSVFTLGFIGMYLLYEVLHRRAHTRPPRSRYGRWRRKNHFAHHFVDPRLAQGVTTPFWDFVFATRLRVDRVRVPRRVAMPWLVDATGDILPEYVADYELVGSRKQDEHTRRRDTEAAMANKSPEL